MKDKIIIGATLLASFCLTNCGGGSVEKKSNQSTIVGHCAHCSKEIYDYERVDKMGNLIFCSEVYGKECLTMYRLNH
jgi:hypothetical protein